MTLKSGTHLGPYEILSILGAGGGSRGKAGGTDHLKPDRQLNLDCAAPTLIEFLLNQGDENRCVPDYPCLPQCWLYPFPLQHLFPLQHQGRKNRRYDFSG